MACHGSTYHFYKIFKVLKRQTNTIPLLNKLKFFTLKLVYINYHQLNIPVPTTLQTNPIQIQLTSLSLPTSFYILFV